MVPASRQRFREKYYASSIRQLSGRVLDVGCGRGKFFAEYSTNAHITAVDGSLVRLNVAMQELQRYPNLSTELERADAEALPFPAAFFDAITFSFLFCSVTDMEQVAMELTRVTRPHAALIMIEHVRSTIPIVGLAQDLLNPLNMLICNNCRLNRNPTTLLQKSGFDIEEIHYSKHIDPWLFLIGRRRV